MNAGNSILDLVTLFGVLLVSLSFHEAMHGFAAYWLGDTTAKDLGRLTLNPLKHVDIFTTVLIPFVLILFGLPPLFIAKPVPFNPLNVKYEEFGAALLALAGPFTNLIIATVAALILRLPMMIPGSYVYSTLILIVQVNIGFFVFNMIPFPPLDGSRVLYTFAPEPIQDFMRKIESFGLMAIVLFFFVLFPLLAPVVSNLNNFFFHILVG